MSTKKEHLYQWLIDRIAYNNSYYIPELDEYITINETPIYRGFDIIETTGDTLFIKDKSFSQSYDVAYDFAQMTPDSDCYIVEIDTGKIEIINILDIYNDLKSDFTFADSDKILIHSEKEVIAMEDWIKLSLKNRQLNLTGATIYNFKGELMNETTKETTLV